MSKLIKPLLAKDVIEDKLKFPIGVTPKIDGSFAFIQNAKLYARSLKPHENLYTTELYSNTEFDGLRGELISGDNPVAQDLCRNSSSALRTIHGEPYTTLWCFDYVLPDTVDLAYSERIKLLEEKVKQLHDRGYDYIHIIPLTVVDSIESYRNLRDEFMKQGYEGCVVRDLNSKHKEGRSSSVKPDLWRWKPWGSSEIRVTRLVEEMKNNNEAKKNELGRTERSTHQENLEGKGTLGAIVGTLVTPVKDCYGEVITEVGTELTISTGSLTEKDCKELWDDPSQIVGKLVEFEFMNYGLKDLPRFAQFKRVRSEIDM